MASWAATAACAVTAGCGSEPDTRPVADDGDAEDEGAVALGLSGACSAKILDVAPAGRQPALGGGVTIQASGTCQGGAAPQFRFSAKLGRTETVLCDWQTGSTCSVSTTPFTRSGYYSLVVQTRRTGQTDPDKAVARRYAFGPVCTEVAIAATREPGGQVAIVVSAAICDPGTVPEFRFRALPPGGTWTTFADYQASGIAKWDPGDADPGRAYFSVQVRRQGELLNDLVSTTIPYDFGLACTATTLTVGGTGSLRTLTARAGCSTTATPEYRFSAQAPDGTVSVVRDWDYANTVAWDVAALSSGRYLVSVEVRAVENRGQTVSRIDKGANVGAPCSIAMAPLPADLTVDQLVPFSATTTCASPELFFRVRPETGAWTTACDFAGSGSCDWLPPAGSLPGKYYLQVQARHAGGTIVQATRNLLFELAPAGCVADECMR